MWVPSIHPKIWIIPNLVSNSEVFSFMPSCVLGGCKYLVPTYNTIALQTSFITADSVFVAIPRLLAVILSCLISHSLLDNTMLLKPFYWHRVLFCWADYGLGMCRVWGEIEDQKMNLPLLWNFPVRQALYQQVLFLLRFFSFCQTYFPDSSASITQYFNLKLFDVLSSDSSTI